MSSVSSSLFGTTSSPSSTTSLTPSATSVPAGNNNNAPSGFYKNLFYILIGLLCAFGLVSFLSLLRARRRRTAILREAERLGVLVPGIPGYIPVRDRSMMTWTTPEGMTSPDWWEVGQDKNGAASESAVPSSADSVDINFLPLGIVPPVEELSREPAPLSPIPYFPNHLAYRPDSLFPPPSRFKGNELSTLDGLDGEHVEVLTIIQMPRQPWDPEREVSEEEEVIKEWANIELGMVKMSVGNEGHRQTR